jgi:hypothetical protein
MPRKKRLAPALVYVVCVRVGVRVGARVWGARTATSGTMREDSREERRKEKPRCAQEALPWKTWLQGRDGEVGVWGWWCRLSARREGNKVHRARLRVPPPLAHSARHRTRADRATLCPRRTRVTPSGKSIWGAPPQCRRCPAQTHGRGAATKRIPFGFRRPPSSCPPCSALPHFSP